MEEEVLLKAYYESDLDPLDFPRNKFFVCVNSSKHAKWAMRYAMELMQDDDRVGYTHSFIHSFIPTLHSHPLHSHSIPTHSTLTHSILTLTHSHSILTHSHSHSLPHPLPTLSLSLTPPHSLTRCAHSLTTLAAVPVPCIQPKAPPQAQGRGRGSDGRAGDRGKVRVRGC